MYKCFLSVAFIFILSTCALANTFDFNANCQAAYQKIFSLQVNNAQTLLEQEKKNNPQNAIPYFLDNYIECINLFINENTSALKVLEKNKEARISKMEEGDKSSPYFLYTQAEIYIQCAIANVKMGEYLTAFWESRKGIKLLEQNKIMFPNFLPNNISLGIIHALIGAIPDNYKWEFNMLGYSGTIEQGVNELKTVVYSPADTFTFHEEAVLLYVFSLKNLANNVDEAWRVCENPELISTKDNLLNQFLVSLIAINSGRNNQGISILINRSSGKEYVDFPFLDYMLGVAKLNALDKDANVYLLKFISKYKGQNYLKDAYQKLAWYYLINGDSANYIKYMEQCKLKGKAILDTDKQALHEAEYSTTPNSTILKSRLLSDGGYYSKAIETLNEKPISDFDNIRDKIEYAYRSGRIYDLWKKNEKAILFYQTTLIIGKEYNFYFTANASLHLGMIYEKQGDTVKAKNYFRQTLEMNPAEYANSIHLQAKAGLNRLKK